MRAGYYITSGCDPCTRVVRVVSCSLYATSLASSSTLGATGSPEARNRAASQRGSPSYTTSTARAHRWAALASPALPSCLGPWRRRHTREPASLAANSQPTPWDLGLTRHRRLRLAWGPCGLGCFGATATKRLARSQTTTKTGRW